ncbi:MAG: signal peptidase II [Candidatus Marinimicrobia bacterium]|nr:signal peptidase II [Candidatus Neomarinimicrobiota bacterium]
MLKSLSVAGLVVIFDQITKQVVRNNMGVGDSFDILGTLLRFTFVENKGLAFSIKVSNLAIFTGLSFIASAVVLYYLYKYRNEGISVYLPLALIFGGAVGNMIDRVLFSKVVDFIDVGISSYRWPVFNVADSAVSVGLVWFLIASWMMKGEEKEPEVETAD